ncbi:MAG TPA: response regulator [Gemmatimonadota bacterium]|nr:response regulator [Gemmatimonadota bacterium]
MSTPTRILLVDDHLITRERLGAALRSEGFEVNEVSNAASAIAEAWRQPPTLVLQDLLLPDMDGLELTAELRRIPGLESVPILALFGFLNRIDGDRITKAGVTGFMVKPVEPSRLVEAIHEFLAGRGFTPANAAGGRGLLDDPDPVQLLRSTWFQAAQLSVLGGVADALARRDDPERALQDVLAVTLHAAGISRGAIFLKDSGGVLRLRHAIGFPPTARADIEGFFGHWPILEQIVAGGAAVSIPSGEMPESVSRSILSAAQVATAQVVPLVSYDSGAGAIVLGARQTDIASEVGVAFAQAVGTQIVQSLELAHTFTRLAASEERYRSLFDNANDAVAVSTSDGVLREVNRRMEEILGLPRDQVVGRHISEFSVPGSDLANFGSHEVLERSGTRRTPPLQILRSDGEHLLIEFSSTAVSIDGETLILSLGRDVTEEVQARAQLMVADRMVSVGTLAAGVAHEINNPLMAVAGNLDVALADLERVEEGSLPGLDRLRSGIREAREAAAQVQNIVRDLKVFSRSDQESLGPVDIHRVLDSSIRMAWNQIRHRAQLIKSYEDVPRVIGNEFRLGQVFLNLLINAVQAMPEGAPDANEIRVVTRPARSGDCVVVEVADTGCGIAPDVRAKIFDPFFTTKEVGVGTGLGLSICHRIVTDLDGSIEVDSEVGRGTVFRVSLVATPERESSGEPSPAPVRGDRRVLVIDDDRAVSSVIARLLEPHHRVEIAPGCGEALARIEAGQRYDILLCDLMMPNMTGMDLHAELSRAAPDQAERMIFMTGGASTQRARDFLSANPNPRIEKPFDTPTLLALLDEV